MTSFSATFVIVVVILTAAHHCHCCSFNDEVEVTGRDDHVQILDDGQLLTLTLDNVSAAGFHSRSQYLFGKFQMQMKLVSGNSAGTVTAYYLSSEGISRDEIDFEFLGNLSGEPYTLHTNVYAQGVGKKEQQFSLWFDPTQDFHTYTILWNYKHIVFYVDETPIREFRKSGDLPFPSQQPMVLYSSLWSADEWATRGGLIKTDWTQAPFVASFRNYSADACEWVSGTSSCNTTPRNSSNLTWFEEDMDPARQSILQRVQNKYMIYNYCTDNKRFPSGFPPECSIFQ